MVLIVVKNGRINGRWEWREEKVERVGWVIDEGRRSFIGVFGYSEKASHQVAQSNGGNTKETKTEIKSERR